MPVVKTFESSNDLDGTLSLWSWITSLVHVNSLFKLFCFVLFCFFVCLFVFLLLLFLFFRCCFVVVVVVVGLLFFCLVVCFVVVVVVFLFLFFLFFFGGGVLLLFLHNILISYPIFKFLLHILRQTCGLILARKHFTLSFIN